MHDYLAPMFGDTGATIAQFVITLVVVLLVILVVFWLIRLFTNGRLGAGPARGRQPRLAVLDALPLDQRRRLILVRRDNVEHLILIGGPSDVVVEPGIQRAPQQTRRLEPIRQEPLRQEAPRPEPVPARPPEPVQARPAPQPQQNARPIPAAPIEPAAPRQTEPRRPELTQPAEIEAAAPVEAQARRAAPVFDEASEAFEERAAEAQFAAAVEPEAAFEPVQPPQQRPTPPVAPTPPQRPAPEPRTGRGFPSFLSGNRPRHTPTTVEIPPESAPVPRPTAPQAPMEPIEGRSTGQRPRPYDPRPLLGSQQTPVAPSLGQSASESPSFQAAPRRANIPPAPPVVEADPFAGLDDEAERLARFEPIFDLGPDTAPSQDDAHLFGVPQRMTEADIPSVEAPQPNDAPVVLAEDFLETPPTDEHSESERSSAVGDLEKEMARLLGEISSSRKS